MATFWLSLLVSACVGGTTSYTLVKYQESRRRARRDRFA